MKAFLISILLVLVSTSFAAVSDFRLFNDTFHDMDYSGFNYTVKKAPLNVDIEIANQQLDIVIQQVHPLHRNMKIIDTSFTFIPESIYSAKSWQMMMRLTCANKIKESVAGIMAYADDLIGYLFLDFNLDKIYMDI